MPRVSVKGKAQSERNRANGIKSQEIRHEKAEKPTHIVEAGG